MKLKPRVLILEGNGLTKKEISIKQGCYNTVPFEALINDNGEILELPAGATAKIRMRKPDGHQVLNDLPNPTDNKVTFYITEQMQAAHGQGEAELIVYDGQDIYTTASIKIRIVPSVHNDSELESTYEGTSLISAMIKMDSKLDKTGDTKDNTTSFAEAETDTDIATGETHSTIFGKILKSIKTLRTGKIDKSDIIQTDTTNDTTKVPSSAVTYALGQEIDTLNNDLAEKGYNKTAEAIDVVASSQANPFTCPSDGYIRLQSGVGVSAGGIARIMQAGGAGAWTILSECYGNGSSTFRISSFVRKGSIINITNNGLTGALFIPLVQ